MKTDLFQSCGHCWVFQICWHIDCSTFTASSFRIPSPPLALFIVMLSKPTWLHIPGCLALGQWSHHRDYLGQFHESRQIGSGQTRDGKSKCRHSRNQQLKWTGMANLTQMTINLLQAGIPQKKWSSLMVNKGSEMQYLDAISKMTERSLFFSKANHSISQ